MSNSRVTVQYKMKKPIVLIGMMGVGKSRIGFEVAKRLDIPMIDSDREVEVAASYSVADIFEIFGEKAFRDVERRVIRRLVEEEDTLRVIATGGGAITSAETTERLNKHSYCIWLDAHIDTLIERTSRNDRRPLLQTGDPAEILSNLLDSRKSAYESASRKKVNVDNNSVPKTVQNVIKAVEECIQEDEALAENVS